MVSFGEAEENQITSGDFGLETDMKVFIDMGHDTLKAARIYDNDWGNQLNHFEVPTVLIPELHHTQVDLMKLSPYDFDKRSSVNFKFFKQNVEALTDRVLAGKEYEEPNKSYHQRPMINGLIREGIHEHKVIDSFQFMWEHIGHMFVQELEAST